MEKMDIGAIGNRHDISILVGPVNRRANFSIELQSLLARMPVCIFSSHRNNCVLWLNRLDKSDTHHLRRTLPDVFLRGAMT